MNLPKNTPLYGLLGLLSLALLACRPDFSPAEGEDAVGQPLSSEQDYDEATYKWGYADANGRLLIEGNFDETRPFSQGLAVVRIASRWGYIDKRGKMVIAPRYKAAWSFSEGLARVQWVSGKTGFINRQGEWVIDTLWDEASDFGEAHARVRKGDLWGLIDLSGQLKIAPQFQSLGELQSGRAVARQNEQYGFINTRGEWLIQANFDRLRPFAAGLARATKEGKTGFIDSTGNWVIAANWTMAGDFVDGLAPVAGTDEKWGLINTKGQWEVKPRYDQLWYGGDSLWIVEASGRYGAIDGAGKVRLPIQFQQLQSFSEGFAPYQRDELWGFVHRSGQLLSSAEFGLAWPFVGGLARVATRRGLTFIDTLGQIVFQPRYLDLRDLHEGLIEVQIYE